MTEKTMWNVSYLWSKSLKNISEPKQKAQEKYKNTTICKLSKWKTFCITLVQRNEAWLVVRSCCFALFFLILSGQVNSLLLLISFYRKIWKVWNLQDRGSVL